MQLNCLTYGDPGAEAVLIVHGLLGSARNWGARAKGLARTHFVAVPDLRNHGDSLWADTMTYPDLVGDLVQTLDRQLVARAHVIGHSLGGKCAMGLALMHGARVKSLIVVDIAPRAYEHDLNRFVQALIDTDLAGTRSRAEIERRLAARVPDRAMRLFLLTNLVTVDGGYRWKANLPVLAAHYREISRDIGEVFPGRTYGGPTLFVRGGRSDYVGDGDRERVLHLFPAARFATIKDAGHWPHSDKPEVFDSVVTGFLQGLER